MKKTRKNSVLPGGGQLRCHCGSQVVLRDAADVCRAHRMGAKAYVCARYPACDSYVMAHPDTQAPMGSLAGPELRKLRREAHLQFNQLYQSGLMTKREAYQWLAYMVQAPMEHAHIGHLGDYYCKVVVRESKKLLESQLKLAKAAGGENYAVAH
ncbi:hypothetical protein SDC9_104988 [bioreactor metagenome]|uniref:Uncharacterized protein n=1 Tax=bioreactor metagenome TaxID=1076179 RepID=A0A645AYG1_9ZZZZ